MEEQLRLTTFDPQISNLVQRIHELASHTRGKRLENALDRLVEEFHADEDMGERIADDMRVHEQILQNLTVALGGRFIKGKRDHHCSIITKCGPCANSGKKSRRESAKQMQIVPVDDYIFRVDLTAGLVQDSLVNAGYDPNCPSCGAPMELVNVSNLVMPAKPGAIYAISTRVKSPGRYCKKLVDRIFYDDDDERMQKRNLFDRYAFKIIPNYPDGLDEKKYRRLFQRQLGVPVTGNRPFEDEVCYAIYGILKKNFQVDAKTMEDLMRNPKRRKVNGRTELYKILQFHMQFQGRKFEGQIKSRDTFLREQDRKSAIYHGSYEEIEEMKRQLLWAEKPEAVAVYKALMKVFSEGGDL